MTIHDIAIRIDKHLSKDTKQFLKNLNKQSIKYIWFKEKKKKSGMIHYHGRLHIETNTLLSSCEKKLRRDLEAFYKNSKMINPWWVGKIKSVYKYNRYIAKERDVYKTNWSDEEIKAVLEDVKKFKVEAKTPMKDQLLTAFKSLEITIDGIPTSKVYDMIINYHISRGYLPPTRSLLQQYAIYVLVKSEVYDTSRVRQQIYDLV